MTSLILERSTQLLHLSIRPKKILRLVLDWNSNYKTRKHLASLPDHLFDDIGLNRDEVESEIRKPFWKK